jgi:hypothetical protein
MHRRSDGRGSRVVSIKDGSSHGPHSDLTDAKLKETSVSVARQVKLQRITISDGLHLSSRSNKFQNVLQNLLVKSKLVLLVC